MIAALTAALETGETALIAAALVFARIGGAIAALPLYGETSLPARVKLVAALALTALVAPAVATPDTLPRMPEDLPGGIALLGGETVVGLAFGLLIRLLIHALQIAGMMIAQSTSLAQLLGGAGADPMPAIGHLLVVAALALIAITDLHVAMAAAVMQTYALFPVGAVMQAGALAEVGIAHVARAFGLAFSLAAPFLLGSFVYQLALGAINRAMPQLMVVFVGAPALTGFSLAGMALIAPLLLQVWADALAATLAAPFGTP